MIKKLTSRKFAMAIVMVIAMLILATDKNVACVCATIIAIVYMLAEAIVDKARAIKRNITDTASVTKYIDKTEEEKDEDK